MRTFSCQRCASVLFFENTTCLGCGAELGYAPDLGVLGALAPLPDRPGEFLLQVPPQPEQAAAHAGAPGGAQSGAQGLRPDPLEGRRWRKCRNYTEFAVCNGLVDAAQVDAGDGRCSSCALTRTIPDLALEGNRQRWYRLELAKRRMLGGLSSLGLSWQVQNQQQHQLRFDFLSPSEGHPVLTGHHQGVITLNITEADDEIREQVRTTLGERYRTLLGHFRHESGHFFWDRLVAHADLAAFRACFGDERADYQGALKRYYEQGPPAAWQERHISAYASLHPWEDWAETWAHYLHMVDAVESGGQFALALSSAPSERTAQDRRIRLHELAPSSFAALIRAWIPLTTAINTLNRSMGWPDWYPFVLSEAILAKLCFVHELIHAQAPTVRASTG